ncbi:MAG: hypothetical protein ACI4K7_03670 [Oscillospiraceae bacterium]
MQQYCKLTQTDDEGFVDFSFDIISTKKKLFGSIFLECAACDEGKNVGFCLEIKCNMRGITNNDPRTFCTYPQGMKLTYKNGLSNDLISSISRSYGLEAADLKLKESAYIECGALRGNPMALLKEEVQFKCFLESHDEKKYAEFYFNVDLPNQKLYLKEKTPDYRENIVRYFCE